MSAIWGTISFSHEIPTNIDSIMKTPYQQKCKIDTYHSEQYQNCYMGCGIQHITKESVHERLPIVDHDKHFILTADCIIDNRTELMQTLSISDTSMPDGDLIYCAYQKWGIDCVNHLRGLFSIAIWEEQTKTLYLVSDHVSSRCLYYYRHEDTVTFSTLLTPILALYPELPLNELYCMDYLAAPTLIPTVVVHETPYQNVYKLPHATILTITEKNIQQSTYWSPAEPLADCDCKTANEYGSYFRKLLTDCVSDAIRTNGEIGIALSSGLDSSSVGTIAADLLQPNTKNLFAYTYVPFEEVKENTAHQIYNETKDVEAIIAMHPNILPHFLCNEGKNAIESIPDGLNTLEIPYKAFVNYPNLDEIYAHAAKAGCRIVLSGQFGNSTISYGNMDPIFYDLYHKKHYLKLLKSMNNLAVHMKIPRRKFLLSYLRYLHKISLEWKHYKTDYKLYNSFLSDDFIKRYPLQERFDMGQMHIFSDLPNTQSGYQEQLICFSGCTYMGEWETKIGLKHGIVLRDPTKDSRMVRFCYHLPYDLFAYKGTTKWLIRGNMKDMIPQHIINNWNRHGIQNDDWNIRIARDWDTLKPLYIEALKSDAIRRYIDSEQVLSLINEKEFSPLTHDMNSSVYLFSAYILALFMQK